MEQFDIFELDPLGGWRVLHGHGAMIYTICGSELVKAYGKGAEHGIWQVRD